jgi:hypothetical protein
MEFIGELERLFATSLYPLRVPIGIGLAILLVVIVAIARRRGWFAAARRHPGRTATVGIVAVAVLAPAAWYLGSPLFIRTSLVEAPTATSGTVADPGTSPRSSGGISPEGGGRSGRFMGADEFHFASGTAHLIETAPGTWVVRFEDFSVRNGPDLYVYLSPEPSGYSVDAVELGTLKATDGSFNTDVPAGTDVAAARSVVIWCRQFAVQFAVASLSS